MTEEKLRELFLATNTEEPLAGGWPGLLRYGMAVSLEAKREALLEAADFADGWWVDTFTEYQSYKKDIGDELRRMADEMVGATGIEPVTSTV